MRVRGLPVALALVVAAGVLALARVDADAATARLTLDGKVFRPELALTLEARSVGLMNRIPAPEDGMLFVFRRPTTGGFWMKNTHVPLLITFFDVNGRRVARFSMKPCHADPCKIYEPSRPYRFALELPADDRRPAMRLGPLAQLKRLVARAS